MTQLARSITRVRPKNCRVLRNGEEVTGVSIVNLILSTMRQQAFVREFADRFQHRKPC
jgi:hypothetical protein